MGGALEMEIRGSLQRAAGEQPGGVGAQRSSLTMFSQLLMLHGVIDKQQLGAALKLVQLLSTRSAISPPSCSGSPPRSSC